MPLVNHGDAQAGGVHNFLNHKLRERNQKEPISRTGTPSHRPNESSARRNSSASHAGTAEDVNPLGARDMIVEQDERWRRAEALNLKVDVPNTLGPRVATAKKEQMSVMGPAPTTSRTASRPRNPGPEPETRGTFDDTSSLHFDDSEFQDNENPTIVWKGRMQAPISQRHGGLQERPLGEEHVHQPYPSGFRSRGIALNLEPDWRERADEERKRYEFGARQVGFGDVLATQFDSDDPQIAEIEDDALEDDLQGVHDTPSRAQTLPPPNTEHLPPAQKSVTFDESPALQSRNMARETSPGLEIPRQTKGASVPPPPGTRVAPHKEAQNPLQTMSLMKHHAEKPLPAQRSRFGHSAPAPRNDRVVPILNTFEKSSRDSDYPTSSEDEVAPPQSKSPTQPPTGQKEQPNLKRQREDKLDYDISTLKSMNFDRLNNEVFTHDPRNPAPEPAFDAQGNRMTLAQRLINLTKMKEDDQKLLFRVQNDEEWSQTGSWFIEKFQEDLKRLMEVRVERRKISMRFENEVRRRQKDVEWCTAGVEEEMKGLKKGGGELIEGRLVGKGGSGSRMGTPVKK